MQRRQREKRLILLTEDSELQSAILLAMSRDAFRLEEAGTIPEMLEKENRGEWDVVLLDLDAPGSEGIEGLHQIRQKWVEAPVIVATRDNTVEMGKRIVQEQVFFYSVKPVNVWEIGTILEAAWGRAARLSSGFQGAS